MTPDNPDPLEVGVAKILENEVFGCCIPSIREAWEVAAIIAQHYAPVIAENERLEALVGELGEALGRLCREADELDRAGLADAFDQADATLAKLEKARG